MAGGKRSANSDLNHNNWEEEEEPEDAGKFIKASEEILKNRVIKIARRRNPIGSGADQENKGIFSNFSGFSKMPVSTTTTSSFSFLSNLTTSTEQPKTNGLGVNNPTAIDNSSSDKPKEYYAKIKGLNQSVSNWIKKHVDTNPFLNLTPIFRDYEKYFDEIEHSNTDKVISKFTDHKSTATKTTNALKFDEPCKMPLFSDGKKMDSPIFTFGKTDKPTSNLSSGGFNFGAEMSKPFTNIEKPVQVENNADAETDEPPKVEFTPVVEEGHIYTIRCKVFVKNKDNTYVDKGIGTLFLKPVPNNDKVQLIVRADTSLGLLLCNFILSSNIPTQRMGKKDVMLVCVPLPENIPPPVPVLLRVKSPEDADELLTTLEKHKK